MKKRWVSISVLVCAILLTLAGRLSWAEGVRWVSAAPQAQMGTSFTYQGRLTDGTSPANGTYDFQFALYDDAGSGTQVGSTVIDNEVANNGGGIYNPGTTTVDGSTVSGNMAGRGDGGGAS